MDSNKNLNQAISKFRQSLASQKQDHLASIEQITSLEQELELFAENLPSANAGTVASGEAERIMIANGRRLTQDEIRSVKEDDFDVVLNMTTHRLRRRQDPANHTKLRESRLQGIGPHRVKILAYMLEYPDSCICAENAPTAYDDPDDIKTPNAFTKTISLLRQALCTGGRANPYVRDEPAWELSSRRNARAYRMDPRWRYLLVKWV